jgi:hypothetical protein
MTVKDISLKYGILPERVKAVVWQNTYFWLEVYPKIGATGKRLADKLEKRTGDMFGYCDYGLDLEIIA